MRSLEEHLYRLPIFAGTLTEDVGCIPPEDKRTEFALTFLSYDFRTGLFIATGNDEHGPSGIVGAVDDYGAIKFQKTYVELRGTSSPDDLAKVWTERGTLAKDLSQCRIFDYTGTIITPSKGPITIEGTWKNRYHFEEGHTRTALNKPWEVELAGYALETAVR